MLKNVFALAKIDLPFTFCLVIMWPTDAYLLPRYSNRTQNRPIWRNRWDLNPWPSQWQWDILTNWTTAPKAVVFSNIYIIDTLRIVSVISVLSSFTTVSLPNFLHCLRLGFFSSTPNLLTLRILYLIPSESRKALYLIVAKIFLHTTNLDIIIIQL